MFVEPLESRQCLSASHGDVNGDMHVDSMDFNIVALNFNQQTSQGDCNGDGRVNAFDFNAVASNFGKIFTATPETFGGDLSVAYRYLNERAVVCYVGDSTMNDQAGGYFDAIFGTLQPERFAGYYLPGGAKSLGASIAAGPRGGVTGMTVTEATEASGPGPNGLNDYPLWRASYGAFNGTQIPAYASLFGHSIHETGLLPDYDTRFASGAWADGKALTHNAIIYRNANGLANFRLRSMNQNGNVAYENTLAQSANGAPGWVKYTNSIAARTYETGGLFVQVQPEELITPAAGSNLIVGQHGIDTGEDGLVVSTIAMGGWRSADFIDDRITDAHFAGQLAAMGVNIVHIRIGINDLGFETPATFYDNINEMMDRFLLANANMSFVLESPYDLGGDATAEISEYADKLWQITQERPRTFFINLFEQAGPFASLDVTYLPDHIHPKLPEGYEYFVGKMNAMLEAGADASLAETDSV